MSKPQNPTPLWLEKSSASLYWVLAACLVAEEIHILATSRLRMARNDKVAGEGVVLRSWAPLAAVPTPARAKAKAADKSVRATQTSHTSKAAQASS